MNKKDDEFVVLRRFINEFDNNITILPFDEAKFTFPNYNGENPDFIVVHKKNYIGIELFELVLSKNKNILMSQEEINHGIKNLPHLKIIREKLGTKLLYENESLADVAIERINDKVLNKINNYVTDKIWLLGYANKPFNFRLLETEIEDNNVNIILTYIKNNIRLDNRIENIFLFQCWANYNLFNVLQNAL
jgi:hypothetical protein